MSIFGRQFLPAVQLGMFRFITDLLVTRKSLLIMSSLAETQWQELPQELFSSSRRSLIFSPHFDPKKESFLIVTLARFLRPYGQSIVHLPIGWKS